MDSSLVIVFVILLSEHICGYRDIDIIRSFNRPVSSKLINAPSIADIISSSVELALENCQKQFEWDRWNCPAVDFLSKRTTSIMDRETAFVQAITMAALIFKISKNCKSSDQQNCGCIFQEIGEERMCGEDVDADVGEKIARDLLEPGDQDNLDAQGYAQLHNNRAGRLAVKMALQKHCKCHGLSGSCSMQTCWTSVNAFPEIADNIRQMYEFGQPLQVDNTGKVDQNVREDALVYVYDSPDYCKQDLSTGWRGTQGRQCSRIRENNTSLQERRSCKTLCRQCGYRVRKHRVVRKRKCNCNFNWCCSVTCDVCTDTIDEYFCE